MYVQGVSTRKVREITEELCGHSFSASAVSAAAKRLDAELARFARRRLEVAFPYVFLDARYERVREGGVVQSRAVLVVIGVDEAGRRQVLAVELANRESASSWRDLLLGLKERGLRGVELAISDDHAGLKRAVMEVLPAAMWQRCYVHFLRNALDYLPRRAATDDCLVELKLDVPAARCGRGTPGPGELGGQMAGQTPQAVWVGGWRARLRRPSPSTGCPRSTTSTSKAPTS
jgi:putative transposase